MVQKNNEKRIMVIHGPNLNKLGTREPDIYGIDTLDEINEKLINIGEKNGVDVECFQSNHEGQIIDKIQAMGQNFSGLIINPAAFTHTSIAIRDALSMIDIPIIEVHISNIYKREPFRHTSMISGVVLGQITGLGIQGYMMAMEALVGILTKNK